MATTSRKQGEGKGRGKTASQKTSQATRRRSPAKGIKKKKIKSIELNKRFFAITIPLAVVLVGSLIGFLIIGRPSAPEASSPVILSFSSNPEIINKGESATLTWNVSNATSVVVEPGIGSVALTGSRAVRPPQDAIYTLTATNERDSAQATTRVFVSGSAPLSGTLAGVEGKIVFKSDRDGNEEIYVMNADGSNQTNVSNNSAYDGEPAWSPDNTKIAFKTKRDGNEEIYVMDADGSNPTNLSNNSADDAYPAWSPDGTRIAFRSNRDGNWEIYVMDTGGGNQFNLSNNSANDAYPAWSPDGTKIAFRSNRDGNHEIYVMNADGSNQTNLSNNSADDAYPAWSPDGTRIAFRSNRDGNYEIYVMNADGSNQINICPNDARDNFPAWSPDGTKIAFMSDRDGNSEIYAMSADGSNQTNISRNGTDDAEPAWSSAGVIVTPPPAGPKPVINLFAANPGSINPGDSSTLQWHVSDAGRVSISPEIGDVSLAGTRVVYPPESTTFTLAATNSEGTVTATAVVVLSEPERPDLVIADMSFSGGMVTYTIKNEGMVPAGASTSLLQIDGSDVATDAVPALGPGASSVRSFGYSYSCSDSQDDILVVADGNNLIKEMNEENNGYYDSWLCQSSPTGGGSIPPFPTGRDLPTKKIPHKFPDSLPTPDIPRKTPGGQEPALPRYIMVTLESVTILNDKDPTGCGEIQIWSIVSTGETQQLTKFPVRLWYEADTGDTVTINQPIFCLKEDEMEENLGVAVVVLDNDDIPNWVEFNPLRIAGYILDVAVAVALAPVPDVENPMIGEKLGKAFTDWLGSAENIGTHIKSYSRAQGWGADTSAVGTEQHYTYRAGDMRVRYRLDYFESPREIHCSPGRQIEVRLKPITIHDDGDSWPKGKGDIFAWARVCDGFSTVTSSKMLPHEYIVRMPKSGTTDKDDGDKFGVSWPDEGKLILRDYFPGPFLFVEVGVWDEDTPDTGDDHDMLGIYSDWWIIPDYPCTYHMTGRRYGIGEGSVTVDVEIIVMDEIE